MHLLLAEDLTDDEQPSVEEQWRLAEQRRVEQELAEAAATAAAGPWLRFDLLGWLRDRGRRGPDSP